MLKTFRFALFIVCIGVAQQAWASFQTDNPDDLCEAFSKDEGNSPLVNGYRYFPEECGRDSDLCEEWRNSEIVSSCGNGSVLEINRKEFYYVGGSGQDVAYCAVQDMAPTYACADGYFSTGDVNGCDAECLELPKWGTPSPGDPYGFKCVGTDIVEIEFNDNKWCCPTTWENPTGAAVMSRTCYGSEGKSVVQYNCDYNYSFYPTSEIVYGTEQPTCTSCVAAGTTNATEFWGDDAAQQGCKQKYRKQITTQKHDYVTRVGVCATTGLGEFSCASGYYANSGISSGCDCSQCPQIGSDTLSSYGATIVSGVDYSSNGASLGTSPDNHTGGIESCYASSGSNNATFIDSIGTFYWKSQTCNYGSQ